LTATVKFGIILCVRVSLFCELNLPRPWTDDAERELFQHALEQIELADRLGFHAVWAVEHHFLEEYAHSSAPEILLAAASQRTTRIRLGHGIVQMPPAINHPVRVAERVAALDLVSNGRVEFGTGESSSDAELGGFGIDPGKKRAMWEEAVGVAVRCMSDTPFTGVAGEFVQVPPRNVVPKPVQKPHPPLWVACSRRDTMRLAAERGMGALTFAWMDPEDAQAWVDEYYRILDERCVPIGRAVNANVACVTMLMCAPRGSDALARGIEGANFFGFGLAHYYLFGSHKPGRTSVWDEYRELGAQMGYDPQAALSTRDAELSAKATSEDGEGGLQGSMGTPEQVRQYLRRFESAGVDEIIFIAQGGQTTHEDVMGSLEMFGTEVLPEFLEREEDAAARKAKRLASTIERALERRVDDAPALDPDYEFGSMAKSWTDGKPADEFMDLYRMGKPDPS
jgi:alkanesulfonate monooxygenase SsuD/methylene tetrahydromethanopterin reductase-like flavin-dependent oxidoreductase (luciferase family)